MHLAAACFLVRAMARQITEMLLIPAAGFGLSRLPLDALTLSETDSLSGRAVQGVGLCRPG